MGVTRALYRIFAVVKSNTHWVLLNIPSFIVVFFNNIINVFDKAQIIVKDQTQVSEFIYSVYSLPIEINTDVGKLS